MYTERIGGIRGLAEDSFDESFDYFDDVDDDPDYYASHQNGGDFVVFKGDFSYSKEVYEYLSSNLLYGQIGNVQYSGGYVFVKNVFEKYHEFREPMHNGAHLHVAGYNQEQIKRLNENSKFSSYREYDMECYAKIITSIYEDKDVSMFSMLQDYLNFCTVIYDSNKEKLVAGVVNPDYDNTHLYYGYTIDNTLMFSNNSYIIDKFCKERYEMPENSYMIDECIYNFNGEVIKNMKNNNSNNGNDISFINNNKENSDSFFNGLNNLLFDITTNSVKDKIEEDVSNYLSKDENTLRIKNFVQDNIDKETKKELYKVVKEKIDNNVDSEVTSTLEKTFDKVLEDYRKNIVVPVNNIIKLNDIEIGRTGGEFFHEKFEEVLCDTQLDEPIMLVGPAGSGKNVAISQVAKALGLNMYYTNNASNEFKLTGFIDAGGRYQETEFYKAFKNGGVFFLDEIDNSDPSALIVINSALANGYMAFPHETIDRHPDFRMIAAANTWGKGADLEYVGRNILDAATLDRFDNIFFDYDRKLEEGLYPNKDVLEFMWDFRDAVDKSRINHIVSTRGIGKVYKKEINNFPVEHILRANVIKNLSQDDLNMIIGNMDNLGNNKYYQKIKKLSLGR